MGFSIAAAHLAWMLYFFVSFLSVCMNMCVISAYNPKYGYYFRGIITRLEAKMKQTKQKQDKTNAFDSLHFHSNYLHVCFQIFK